MVPDDKTPPYEEEFRKGVSIRTWLETQLKHACTIM